MHSPKEVQDRHATGQADPVPDGRSRAQLSLELNERYLIDVVEKFNLCPWAKAARTGGNLLRQVLLKAELTTALAALAEIERSGVEVGLLIFSQLDMDRATFERFASELGSAYAEAALPGSPQLALAAFHPNAFQDVPTPDQLVAYARKSPEPTLQAIRMDTLQRVRASETSGTTFVDPSAFELSSWLALPPSPPTLRERITQANWSTLRERRAEVESAHRSIESSKPTLNKAGSAQTCQSSTHGSHCRGDQSTDGGDSAT